MSPFRLPTVTAIVYDYHDKEKNSELIYDPVSDGRFGSIWDRRLFQPGRQNAVRPNFTSATPDWGLAYVASLPYNGWSTGGKAMKIVSLNIRHGGGNKTAKIAAWLRAQSADLILLTEWRSNDSGTSLKEAIESAGYISFGETRSTAADGILVAVKYPFSTSRLTPPSSPKGEIVAAELAGLKILCGYFPQGDAKKPFFDIFLEQAASVQTPLLLIGDLNTRRNDIDLEAGAAKFSCANQFIELTDKAEMIDLWRQSNGADAREWTWRSSKNGFRIDHAFGNKALLASASAIKCSYDPSTRDGGLTDHSGVIVDIAY